MNQLIMVIQGSRVAEGGVAVLAYEGTDPEVGVHVLVQGFADLKRCSEVMIMVKVAWRTSLSAIRPLGISCTKTATDEKLVEL